MHYSVSADDDSREPARSQHVCKRPFPSVIAVAWSRTGNLIAAICGNGQAIIWDGNSYGEVARFDYDKSNAEFVAWRPDGKVLAIATEFGISFWQVG